MRARSPSSWAVSRVSSASGRLAVTRSRCGSSPPAARSTPSAIPLSSSSLAPAGECAPTGGDAVVAAEPEPLAVCVESQEQLVGLVQAALEPMLGVIEPDEDGDLPIPAGKTGMWVMVHPDRPVVDILCHVAVDVRDLARARDEVLLLNQTYREGAFSLAGDRIVLRHRINAQPFAAMQLRAVVAKIASDVPKFAHSLIQRVDGVHFHDPERPPTAQPLPVVDERDLVLIGLAEMLEESPLAPAAVAAYFDGNRHDIIAHLHRLVTRPGPVSESQRTLVISQLRQALVHLANKAAREADAAERAGWAARPRSQQLSLLPGLEPSLDDGAWEQGAS